MPPVDLASARFSQVLVDLCSSRAWLCRRSFLISLPETLDPPKLKVRIISFRGWEIRLVACCNYGLFRRARLPANC
jgi:hypothetical protein